MELKALPSYAFQIDFKEKSNTIVLFGRANANYEISMKLLKRNDIEPLTYREALTNINQDNNLLEQVKGKWFYIKNDAEGHRLINNYFFNKRGKLTHGEKRTERNIYAWFGEYPLSIIVNSDEDARESGRRFTIDAGLPGTYLAPIVLGIKQRSEIILPDVELMEASLANRHVTDAIKKTFRS